MPTLPLEVLTATVVQVFERRGVPAPSAQIVAEHLVEAEASGVVSHGLIRVPQYILALANGEISLATVPRIISEFGATVRLDGGRGFGPVMAKSAMERALSLAAHSGIGAVTLTNCSHTGRLGSYTEYAARQGFIGLMLVNAGGYGQWVAPFGGTAGRLSTNPLSIAVPTDNADPLVLDMSTSAVPEGRIRAYLQAGRSIPKGWVIDHAGRPTTHPADLYGPPRGAILPFGGYKGFGLGLMVDVLAGALSGAGCCHDPLAPTAGITDGAFLLAIQVAAFGSPADVLDQVRSLVAHVKSVPAATGVNAVLVPGEPEFTTRRQRMATGIPVADATWNAIESLVESADDRA